MADKFQKRTSGIIVSIIIFILIFAFAISGTQFGSGPTDAIGMVGSHPLKIRDYNQRLNNMADYYSKIMGGEALSAKQIEQFGLKNQVVEMMVKEKLKIIQAEELGLVVSPKEISTRIKDFPIFQTNNQFDLNKYKNLLTANQFSAQNFEEIIANEVRVEKIDQLQASLTLPSNFAKDLREYQAQKIQATVVGVNKTNLASYLPIEANEVQEFLNTPQGLEKTESLFNVRKESLGEAEQVKARHILISRSGKSEEELKKKVSEVRNQLKVSNFSNLAKKFSEDPGSKDKGGDLGWFEKGTMMPDFETAAFSLEPGKISDPIATPFGEHFILVDDKKEARAPTFDRHKNILAQEILRKEKAQDLDQFFEERIATIRSNLSDNLPSLKRDQKKYNYTLLESVEISRLDAKAKDLALPGSLVKEAFNESQKGLIELEDGESYTALKVEKRLESKAPPKSDQETTAGMIFTLSNQLKDETLKELEKKTRVSIRNEIL